MHPGAPSRLPSSYPLRRALGHAHPGEPLGAWVRAARWPLHLRARGCALLTSTDLGYLLRRSDRVVLRVDERVVVLPSETVIAWRTLQVALGAPYLPRVHALRNAFPRLTVAEGRLSFPIGPDAAEPVLAACAAARLSVSATWIDYHVSGSG